MMYELACANEELFTNATALDERLRRRERRHCSNQTDAKALSVHKSIRMP